VAGGFAVKWIMIVIIALMALSVLSGILIAACLALSRRTLRQSPLTDHLRTTEGGLMRLLAVPVAAWLLIFLLILVILLFVGGMCLMYTFALLHGEWFALLDSFPKTAGNVIVHLIYPLQMALFALVTFLLAVGGFQLVLGPVEALARFRLRVTDVADFAGRLAGLLALTAGLEVVKILSFSLLVEPKHLGEFFARDTLPKADPLGVALLAAAMLAAVIAWWRKGRDRP
jgi:hypothetical protein